MHAASYCGETECVAALIQAGETLTYVLCFLVCVHVCGVDNSSLVTVTYIVICKSPTCRWSFLGGGGGGDQVMFGRRPPPPPPPQIQPVVYMYVHWSKKKMVLFTLCTRSAMLRVYVCIVPDAHILCTCIFLSNLLFSLEEPVISPGRYCNKVLWFLLWWVWWWHSAGVLYWMCAESHMLGMPIIWQPFPHVLLFPNTTKELHVCKDYNVLAFQDCDLLYTYVHSVQGIDMFNTLLSFALDDTNM